ncbi:hypothetical protein EVAR_22027_1 [Eumeta japonica]|uniref:Uncharacterized protein n=1 Tax=Eumeta variegata TaxID=151549 RepID=A0A4C1USJ4_EUMVA|nr:hypothetical protein EVAR_22027_1 [Eumeta japonica]
MHTADDEVRGASFCPRRLKRTLPTPDSAKQLLRKSLRRTLKSRRRHPPYYDLKRSPNRCAPRAHGTPLGDSVRAECPRDFLCRDAHLVASIGQSRADDIPCLSAALDEIFKAPIYWGYGQQSSNMLLQGFFVQVQRPWEKELQRGEAALTEEGVASIVGTVSSPLFYHLLCDRSVAIDRSEEKSDNTDFGNQPTDGLTKELARGVCVTKPRHVERTVRTRLRATVSDLRPYAPAHTLVAHWKACGVDSSTLLINVCFWSRESTASVAASHGSQIACSFQGAIIWKALSYTVELIMDAQNSLTIIS